MLDRNIVLGTVALVAVATTLLSLVSILWTLRKRRHSAEAWNFTPPVTILKPLKGCDEGLEENLAGFFTLDYPSYQLIFGVADRDDPAIAVVERLIERFPDRDARLVVGNPVFGLNPKVENLAAMDRYRKHDYLLISDSNVRVRPTYLRETIVYLSDPSVGLVSNLFVGVGENQLGAILENLQLNGFISGGMALASTLGITCVVGKSMLMPARALAAIGGFASVRNLLAEDQAIGIKVRKAGYAVRLSRHVIENVNRDRGIRWFLNRHSRWYKIRRRMAAPAFLVEPTANLTATGLVWAFSGDSGIAWGGMAFLLGLGIARDAIQTKILRGTFPKPRHLLFSPVKDLVLLAVWLDALVSNRIEWRGNRFLIGRFTRLRSSRATRRVRRRVRKIRRVRKHHHE